MNILQISPPKTGSYWLHSILINILQNAKIPIRSFIQNLPIYKEMHNKKLSFKGQSGVDMMDIENSGCYYRVSSFLKEPIEDIKAYAEQATLAWTHSTYCNRTRETFQHFDKKICIVRDPRDRALSVSKFAFTPYMETHYPTPYATPEEYLEAQLDQLMEQWVWFYGNYLLRKESLDMHFVFYENLLHGFSKELDDLLIYLDLELSSLEKQKIGQSVSFSRMKSKSPRHLHKGRSRKWVAAFSEDQNQKAIEKAGFLMDLFQYDHSGIQGKTTPSVPREVPKEEILSRLEQINWRNLYSTPLKSS